MKKVTDIKDDFDENEYGKLDKDSKKKVAHNSERARKNWLILRDHIRKMRAEANFLVMALEDNHIDQNDNIYDADSPDGRN